MEDAQQKTFLAEAAQRVAEKTMLMRQCVDRNDVQGAIDRAADMLKELRTSVLTPRSYYELYMKVVDELRYLEEFFMVIHRAGMSLVTIYQSVQACMQVLPRLYLMITAGACYIRTGQASVKDVLSDMAEMAKGVQQPMRGLFLRNYLSHITRDKLPGSGPAYQGSGGSVNDSVDFVLENFCESNRLWVRMHQQSGTKDKKRREKERKELRLLVGTNLVRLSQLEGVHAELYKGVILPKLLEQVISCRDTIAQSYLMDCAIQVFPDEFHLSALDVFLDGMCKLKEKVKVRLILQSLVRRLGRYTQANPGALGEDSKVASLLSDCVKRLLEERKNLDLAEIFLIEADLVEFFGQAFPDRVDHINHSLSVCEMALAARSDQLQGLTQASADALQALLGTSISTGGQKALSLSKFTPLLECLPPGHQTSVAATICRSVVQSGDQLCTMSQIHGLLRSVRSLWSEESTMPEDLALVGRLLHLIGGAEQGSAADFILLSTAREHLLDCSPASIPITMPPLVFKVLSLISSTVWEALQAQMPVATPQKIVEQLPSPAEIAQEEGGDDAEGDGDGGEEEASVSSIPPPPPPIESSNDQSKVAQLSARKAFQFLHETVTSMAPHAPSLSLRLFLQSAIGADKAGLSAIAYEFVSQAFILYEDELSDSREQLNSLMSMVGALCACTHFDSTDYDALVTKTTQYAAKLLKKKDQSHMVMLCSHLFWFPDHEAYRDPVRVLECLQRSLKLADACMNGGQNVHLFLEILNRYIYFAEKGNTQVAAKYVSGLTALIQDHMQNLDPANIHTQAEATAFLTSTLAHHQALVDSKVITA